jgi:hypothetical protein
VLDAVAPDRPGVVAASPEASGPEAPHPGAIVRATPGRARSRPGSRGRRNRAASSRQG